MYLDPEPREDVKDLRKLKNAGCGTCGCHRYLNENLNDADKALYDSLLDLPDPVLYDYLVRRHEPDDPELARLVSIIRGER